MLNWSNSISFKLIIWRPNIRIKFQMGSKKKILTELLLLIEESLVYLDEVKQPIGS